MTDVHTQRWRLITLGTLFTGYTGYYICRSNLSVATPLILKEFGGVGIDKRHLGLVASAGVLAYALGKISNGVVADYFGGRILFLLGMAVSIVCTVLFGLAGGITAFMVIWAVNRYFQSMGWVALVKVSSRWYPVRVHATVLGILSMSYLLGDAMSRLYLGEFIDRGVGWRGVFLIAAGTLGAIAIGCLFLLKSSPRDVGGEEPPANPDNVFGQLGEEARPGSLWSLLGPLFSSFAFWTICLLNVGLTLIRETFNFWTPTYLNEMVGLSPGQAAKFSLAFPLVGAMAALSAGFISDRLGGKHGRVAVPSLVLLIVAVGLLTIVPVEGKPWLAILLISMVSFCLIAPYSFLSGVVALDLGGKRGASTAAGFIDSAGYLAAVLSGWLIGAIAERHGWTAVFQFLTAAAVMSLIVGVTYWVHEEFYRK